VWWLGGIYSPNHQNDRWCRLLSYGAPDSPVRHRTLSGAPAMSPGRWVPTIGASDKRATGQSGGAPDNHYSLSGVPSGAALTTARADTHCSLLVYCCKRPLALCSRYLVGTPDSPVNYSGVAPRIPEGGKFGVGFPGAPDTVRCARLGLPLGCLLLSLFEPFLGLFISLL
jgi:hypothetical protein